MQAESDVLSRDWRVAAASLSTQRRETAAALGERVDVVRVGIAWVEASAAITRGALITSDPTGRAVTAAPGAGLNNRIIGIADESASAAGDVIRFMLAPGMLQG